MARLSRDLLVKLKGGKAVHRQWKQGQVSWEGYRDTARLCSNGVRNAKAQLELSLARDAKNNKKCFYRCVSQKRKIKESVPPSMSNTGKFITMDKEKAEYLTAFLSQSSLATSLPTRLEWRDHKTRFGGAKSLSLRSDSRPLKEREHTEFCGT